MAALRTGDCPFRGDKRSSSLVGWLAGPYFTMVIVEHSSQNAAHADELRGLHARVHLIAASRADQEDGNRHTIGRFDVPDVLSCIYRDVIQNPLCLKI